MSPQVFEYQLVTNHGTVTLKTPEDALKKATEELLAGHSVHIYPVPAYTREEPKDAPR